MDGHRRDDLWRSSTGAVCSPPVSGGLDCHQYALGPPRGHSAAGLVVAAEQTADQGDELVLHPQEARKIERAEGVFEQAGGIGLRGHLLHVPTGVVHQAEQAAAAPIRIARFQSADAGEDLLLRHTFRGERDPFHEGPPEGTGKLFRREQESFCNDGNRLHAAGAKGHSVRIGKTDERR